MTPRIREPITRPFARIDGLPVAVHIVGDLVAMAAEFAVVFPGIELRVNSGIRTYAEQEAIFRQRYVTADRIGGRRVYDVRRWQGILWYRISAVGTVAQPGTSNHETGRSVDLYDTGTDAGVASSFLTPRNIWLSQNCHRWGFTHTGRNFREPWHFEQLRVLDPFGGMGKPHSISSSDPGQPLTGGSGGGGINEEDVMNKDQEKKLDKVLSILSQRVGPHNETVPESIGRIVKRQGGSVKQQTVTKTISEGRDASTWGKGRIGGSVKNPSITAMLQAIYEAVTKNSNDSAVMAIMDRAAQIDLTLDTDPDPEYDETDEAVEMIPDED